MGKPTGFMEYQRRVIGDLDPAARIRNFNEFHIELDEPERIKQAARCMDCGVPFCQSAYGCPVYNLIPEWNDFIYQGRWEEAWLRLRATNNFPEFTGRVCPAPCETACVLGINEAPVTIKDNERRIIDRAWESGLIQPRPPRLRTGKRVAVVGSGPAGLAAADQLNQAGHMVTVYERAEWVGGLLMYGIPNMKLDKGLVEKRVGLMQAEGVNFRTATLVGRDVEAGRLLAEHEAVLLAVGSTRPRDLTVPGRNLKGIHFAMEYLATNTRKLLDSAGVNGSFINAQGRQVVVIGGGDTGNDCLGTAMRHGCAGLVNFELLPEPPRARTAEFPWPLYPRLYKSDYGHEEAARAFGRDPREFSILTKEFIDDGRGKLAGIRTVKVAWVKGQAGRMEMKEMPGSEQTWQADLVLLALGFLGPETELLESFGLKADQRGNIEAGFGRFRTPVDRLYAAGDARRGQSLVVWAIHEGRKAARAIDLDLMGRTYLT